jgi:membrane protein
VIAEPASPGGWRQRVRTIIARVRQAWEQYQRDYAFFLAAAMVYYALVSLVPLLLLLLSALGLMLRFSAFAKGAEQQVLHAFEQGLGAELPAAITRLLDGLRQASIIATAVSVIGLVVTASMLFRNLRLSFRAIWKYEPPLAASSVRVIVRQTFLEQAMSFAMVLLSGLLLLMSLAVVSLVQWVGGLLTHLPRVGDTAEWALALPIPLVLVTVTFACLFKFLPPVRLRWRHVVLPAVLCALGWYVAAEIVTLYGVFFGSDTSAYGALGGLLVIMLWMNVVSQLLFFGAELCKVIAWSEPGSGA